ncbi:MAG: SDR family NAD(P)-dependent oxidoreductase [Chloroflexi bacterium]|nr:SDR family NAD(P)-dependent oxidoreductase [Chloroflexota bacterium]
MLNVAASLERGSQDFPDRPALLFEEHTFTYSQLHALCSRAANALATLGIQRGERVALLLANVPPFLAAYFGTLKLGAVAVAINPALKAEEISFILQDSGARLVVTTADLYLQLAQRTLPTVDAFLLAEGNAPNTLAWPDLLAQASPVAETRALADEEPAVILYTSGTTGFPKGAVLSHGNLTRNGAACIHAFQLQPSDRVLLALPTFHCFGQNAALNPTLMAGATLLLHRQFESSAVQHALQQQGVTVFFGVPTLYTLLAEQSSPQSSPQRSPTLRLCLSAAAPLPTTVAANWQKKFGVAVEEGYGLTETCLNTCTHGQPHKAGSIGLPLAGVELTILDPQDHPAPPGELGEVAVRGNNVMLGYWQRPQETADALRHGWFHTGDIGYMDAEGHCFVVDRSKDMINVGGTKVYPSEVEQRLYTHPAIHEAAVYGIPEPLLGEQVCASLVLAAGQQISAEEIRLFCQQTLADFKVPSRIEFVAELPKGRTGKILKRILRERSQLPPPEASPSAPSPSAPSHVLQNWLLQWLSQHLDLPLADLDPHRPLSDAGLTSLSAVRLAQELGTWLGRPLEAVLTWRYPTVAALVAYLTTPEPARPAPTAKPAPHDVEPVAIVGMGCRLPQANTPETFWQLLHDGVDTVTPIPATRWPPQRYYAADRNAPGKLYVQGGSFLKDIEQFDPHFFGMAPREAVSLDPQQRLLLEVSWEALEHAGIAPEQLNGSQTGVFVGAFWDDYSPRNFYGTDPAELDGYRLLSQLRGLMAGRIAYVLGVHGPTFQVDTACSSSLLAVHQACQALQTRECEVALAGGVNLILSPEQLIALCRMGAVAPDGRCKTFAANADGFGRGEGCVVLVLKRLTDALHSGDTIFALIRGSAVNHDGRSNGLTVPNGLAQEAVVRQALHNAGVAPAEIQYVEAHGTGTVLGDPIEVLALANVLGQHRTTPLAIGSVKTNIGHLDAAAGIAGLLKVTLALQHQELPPHLHFHQPNPHIPWQSLPITVPTTLTPWAGPHRLAGISSFGMSGTNVHLVVEAAPPQPATAPPTHPQQLVCLSAKTLPALLDLTHRYSTFLAQQPELSLADVAFTAATGRNHFSHRLAIVADSLADLQQKLALYPQNQIPPTLLQAPPLPQPPPNVAFLFTGQGAQYAQMGHELYTTQPEFRRLLDKCDALLQRQTGESLLALLYPTNTPDPLRIHETQYTQPALFALEYALATLWQSWGVKPDLLLGHSVGELAAACVAGVFSLEDGIRLVAARARLMGALPQDGEMVSLLTTEEHVLEALAPYAAEVSIAAVNSPASVVISGNRAAVQAVSNTLAAEGVKQQRLTVSHAFHSPLMEPMLEAFRAVAESIPYHKPVLPLVSNLTGQLADDEIATPAYWVQHARQAVRFAEGVATLHRQGTQIFLEIGPQPVLLGLASQCLDPLPSAAFLPSLRSGQSDWQQLLTSLGALYVRGVTVDWQALYRTPAGHKVALPTYPFQRQRCWLDATAPSTAPSTTRLRPLIDRQMHLPIHQQIVFEKQFSTAALPFLADHMVSAEVVVPAACHLAMTLSAIDLLGQPGPCMLSDLLFPQPLKLPAETERTVQCLTTLPNRADPAAPPTFQIVSFAGAEDADNTLQTHATGRWTPLAPTAPETVDLAALQTRCQLPLNVPSLYTALEATQIELGPHFRWLQAIWQSEDTQELLAQLETPAGVPPQGEPLFPSLIDAIFQLVAAAPPPPTENTDPSAPWLPFALERFTFYSPPPPQSTLWGHATQKQDRRWDLTLFTQTGQTLATVHGFALRAAPSLRTDWIYTRQWSEQTLARPSSTPQPACWWVFDPASGTDTPGAALAATLSSTGTPTARILPGSPDDPPLPAPPPPLWQTTVDPRTPASFRQLLANLPAPDGPPLAIVYLWGMAPPLLPPSGQSDVEQIPLQALHATATLLHLVQALAEEAVSATLWLVTTASQLPPTRLPTQQPTQQPTPDSIGEQAVGGALWGLARTIPLEHPRLRCLCIDLHDPADAQTLTALHQELLAGLAAASVETEILYQERRRYVARAKRWQRPPPPPPPPLLANHSSYLITGGLGALGLQVAEALVDEGARHLVLSSRKELPPAPHRLQERLHRLQAKGAALHIELADVSQPADVERLLAVCQAIAPLRGIVHAAGVLDDGLIQQQSVERLANVMAPKIQGTWLLHTQTRHLTLDFFVAFSSIASWLGSPGQSNYAAANGFMDTLMQQRAETGLPGLSISWGPWAEIGMAAPSATSQRRPAGGFHPMPPSQAARLLPYLLTQPVSQVGVFALASQLPSHFTHPFWTGLRTEAQPSPTTPRIDWRAHLSGLPASERGTHFLRFLQTTVAHTLGMATPEDVGARQPLFALGLDSLMALELKNKLEAELNLPLRSTLFFDYPTLEQAAQYLVERIFPASTPAEPAGRRPPQPLPAAELDRLAQLSDAEVEALLLETLKNL